VKRLVWSCCSESEMGGTAGVWDWLRSEPTCEALAGGSALDQAQLKVEFDGRCQYESTN
jgi:hypothetical protein